MIIKLILTIFCWLAVLPIIYGFSFGIHYNFFIILVYASLLFIMFIFSDGGMGQELIHRSKIKPVNMLTK